MLLLERLWPRNPSQRILRRGILGDLLLIVLNVEFSGVLAAMLLARLIPAHVFAPWRIDGLYSWWVELLVLWLVKDFVQWCVHNLLHRVPLLWRIHCLHHTTEEMDWLSNWRFHPLESLIYQTALYLPAVLLGFRGEVLVACAFISTAISHFAHANLRWHVGPLKYIINTPEMHVWHHVHPDAGPQNRNFGISLVIWDWIFRTAYLPADGHAPQRLGVRC